MKTPTRHYSLPGGKTTISVTRYLREWNAFTRPVAKLLGCDLIGCDPGILLKPKEGGRPIDISVSKARSLIATLKLVS